MKGFHALAEFWVLTELGLGSGLLMDKILQALQGPELLVLGLGGQYIQLLSIVNTFKNSGKPSTPLIVVHRALWIL